MISPLTMLMHQTTPQQLTDYRNLLIQMAPQDRAAWFQQNPELYQYMVQGSPNRMNQLGSALGSNYDNITSMLQNMRGW